MIQVEQAVPVEYTELYQRYCDRVRTSNKLISSLMWVVLDNGHEIKCVMKKEHIAMAEEMLNSGDDAKVKVGIEAMSRTLGEWEAR